MFLDSRGRVYVIGNYSTYINVFNQDGSFLRQVGREGDGPGEYRGIGRIAITKGDSVVVFDQVLRRYTVLSPDYRYVRSERLPVGPEPQTVLMPDGFFIFNVPMYTPLQVGLPLHLVSPRGYLVRSFGSESGVYRPDVPYLDRRAIAVHDTTTVWSAYRTQYVIDLYDIRTGSKIKEITRSTPWFPPNFKPLKGRVEPDKPEPFLAGIQEDHNGLLWVLLYVPDPNWQTAVRADREHEAHPSIIDNNAYLDTVLEILEPVSGRILGSKTFDEVFTHIVQPGLLARVVERTDGSVKMETARVVLTNWHRR